MTTFSNVLAEAIKYDANGICVYCNTATACAASSIIDFHVSQKYFGTCHIISTLLKKCCTSNSPE